MVGGDPHGLGDGVSANDAIGGFGIASAGLAGDGGVHMAGNSDW